MAEEWNHTYMNEEDSYAYYGVYDFDGEYTVVVDSYIPNIVLTDQPIPDEPERYREGLREYLEHNQTERAMFAAKLYTVLDENKAYRWRKEGMALGIDCLRIQTS